MPYSLTLSDSLSFLVFITSWVSYTFFTKYQARRSQTLSSLLRRHRENWMREVMRRENRIGDAAIVGNVKSVVTFFASTTVLMLAGVLTAISASDSILRLLNDLHISGNPTKAVLQLKLFVLAMIFVYAFFKFTWSIRQHITVGILIGAAPWRPEVRGQDKLPPDLENMALHMAKISDLASHDFNHGLRAYYFSLALLVWLVSNWLFIAATLGVVLVLYQREFRSMAVNVLKF